MADLHLLDINVLPCAYVKDVIEGVWKNLQSGISKAGGKKLHGFKVVGENRLIAVFDGGIEAGMSLASAAYGDQTRVTCTPLRSYESFTEHVLGIDGKSAQSAAGAKLGLDGRYYWLHFTLEYQGLKASDFIAIWAREATAVYSAKSQGSVEIDVYKVVAQREVHAFFKVRDADLLDDIVFTLPIMKELGNQTHVVCKSVVMLPDLSPPQSA